MEVDFINVPEKYRSLIKKTSGEFQKKFRLNPHSAVNVEFTTAEKIRHLNKKYRKIDKPTDVLSFPIWKNLEEIPKTGKVLLGDIIICPSEGDGNLQNLVEHSLKHLVGIHHH